MLGHATFHTYELVIPVFVALWLESFGVSAALLGLMVGAGYALVGVGALPAGMLSDRYDSKSLIAVSILGMGVGFVLLGLADSIVLVAVGLLAWGAAASLYHPAGLSLISRGAEERGTAFAYHGVAGNLGVAAGPFVGAILLGVFPWRTVALILVIPGLIAVALTTRLEFDETANVDDAATDGGPEATTLSGFSDQSRRLLASAFVFVFGIAMLYGLYYRGFLTFLPEVLEGLALFDPVTVGGRTFPPTKYVYAGLLTLGAVGQYVGGKVSDRIRTERALVGIFAGLVVVSLLFVPAADAGVVPFLVVCAVLSFLVYMEAPVHQSVVAKYVPSDVHGLSFGYLYLGTFGVGAVGATLAGVVLTYGTDALLFGLLAAFALCAAGVSAWLAVRNGD